MSFSFIVNSTEGTYDSFQPECLVDVSFHVCIFNLVVCPLPGGTLGAGWLVDFHPCSISFEVVFVVLERGWTFDVGRQASVNMFLPFLFFHWLGVSVILYFLLVKT